MLLKPCTWLLVLKGYRIKILGEIIVLFRKNFVKQGLFNRQAWLAYYLISPPSRLNNFYVDNWFSETIIILCKKKVRPSFNAKSDWFLQEIVVPNILSL